MAAILDFFKGLKNQKYSSDLNFVYISVLVFFIPIYLNTNLSPLSSKINEIAFLAKNADFATFDPVVGGLKLVQIFLKNYSLYLSWDRIRMGAKKFKKSKIMKSPNWELPVTRMLLLSSL